MSDSNSDSEDSLIVNICAAAALAAAYYENKRLQRQERWSSNLSGHKYMTDLLTGNRSNCRSIIRMDRTVFKDLCNVLSSTYGLESTRDIGVREMVGMFIYTVGHGVGNRTIQDRFQHSGKTVHQVFYKVLRSINRMAKDYIKPRDPQFQRVPDKIRNDSRFFPYFENCIGVIDGMHVAAIVPKDDRMPYIGPKGNTTQNIMAVCDFDMLFTFVCAGWEGSAHDYQIFNSIIRDPKSNFPHPPNGKYYLVDDGYPNRQGYLTPYKGERYHLEQFQRSAEVRNAREAFNKAHSSLRSIIERCFSVLKKKWLILTQMPKYPFTTQVQIVIACITLHNFIRMHAISDEDFEALANDNFIPPSDEGRQYAFEVGESSTSTDNLEMRTVRDLIATKLA